MKRALLLLAESRRQHTIIVVIIVVISISEVFHLCTTPRVINVRPVLNASTCQFWVFMHVDVLDAWWGKEDEGRNEFCERVFDYCLCVTNI